MDYRRILSIQLDMLIGLQKQDQPYRFPEQKKGAHPKGARLFRNKLQRLNTNYQFKRRKIRLYLGVASHTRPEPVPLLPGLNTSTAST